MNFGIELQTVVAFNAEALILRHAAGLVEKISTAIKESHAKPLI
jgi:hypothetical protein